MPERVLRREDVADVSPHDVPRGPSEERLDGAIGEQDPAVSGGEEDAILEVIHDRSRLNEWQWGSSGVPFVYSDNTTVSLNPNQNVTFVSVVYTYRWR